MDALSLFTDGRRARRIRRDNRGSDSGNQAGGYTVRFGTGVEVSMLIASGYFKLNPIKRPPSS
jgi:hypothetical protein